MTYTTRSILGALAPLLLVLAIGLAGCAGGATGSGSNGGGIEGAAAPAIGVSPSVTTVNSGEEFDVSIVLKVQNPVNAAGFVMTWTGSGAVECINTIDEGELFKAAGDTLRVGGDYNAGSGTKGQVAISSLADKGVTGSGTLFVFHFKAVTPGEVNLNLSQIQVCDLDANVISIKQYDGKVVIK